MREGCLRRTVITAMAACMAACSTVSSVRTLDAARVELYEVLSSAGVLSPDLSITRLSHVCSLRIDGASYPVIDLHESVKRGLTAAVLKQIVVLAPDLTPVQTLRYTTEEPLYCDGSRLYVFGDLLVDEMGGRGNQILFRDAGATLVLESVDVVDMPMEATGSRRAPPQ
jgi:hypothetical protein